MPDITMCANKYCSLRDKCYRAQAVPDSYYQSYAEFKPVRHDDGRVGCEHFVEVREGDRVR